jgi:2Fe-2S ferredoxin
MATMRVLPLDAVVDVPRGHTLMDAAQAFGLYWPTTCGGEGRCTTCACDVLEGSELLVPMGRSERSILLEERGEGSVRGGLRLACQARVEGDGELLVRKAGVRRSESTS